MKTRVLLADDHRLFREGLSSMLERQPDMEVVGGAETGRVALAMAAELKPDVVIMDIAMPDLNGLEATRRIHAQMPETKILALSMHSDKRFILGMLHAGAAGYLLKASAFDEVVQALRAVVCNKHYVSADIADTLVRSLVNDSGDTVEGKGEVLSPREREVLQLLAEGHGTRDIAERLHISTNTIDTHRAHIMAKLDANSLADLVKFAVREGLTSLE